jgi:hypothetical protein
LKIWKYDVAYHRKLYTCVTCTHRVCVCTSEDSLVLCNKKLGTVIVSTINESNQVNRGVQEVGLGDASPNHDDVVVYSAKKFAGDTSDCKGSGRFFGHNFCKCKSERGGFK